LPDAPCFYDAWLSEPIQGGAGSGHADGKLFGSAVGGDQGSIGSSLHMQIILVLDFFNFQFPFISGFLIACSFLFFPLSLLIGFLSAFQATILGCCSLGNEGFASTLTNALSPDV